MPTYLENVLAMAQEFQDAGRAQAEAFAKIADAAWNEVSSAYSTPPELTDVTVSYNFV